MTSPLPGRDLELLSAYLDNQLSPAEKASLERRLSSEPGLQDALTGLRTTVQALRALPNVKVPRNFTLDPKVYGLAGRRPSVAGGWMGWATALATFLFVVVVAGDLVTHSQTAAQLAAPQPALSPVGAERTASTATEELALEAPAPVSTEAAPAIAAAPLAETETPTSAPAAAGGAEGTALEMQSLAAPTEGTESVTAAADAALEPTVTPPAPSVETPGPKLAPTETPMSVAEAAPPEETTAVNQGAANTAAPSLNWWRLAEVVLGVAALALLGASLWRRRR